MKSRMGLMLQGWKEKLLSFAGREIMIKSVANAIPIFPMSCFRFPKKTCVELNSMISKFWWGQHSDEGRIHWKAWNNLSSSKGEGGMGFRDLELFNRALLAKTAWRMLQEPNAMWVKIMKGIYFPNEGLLSAKRGSKASWGWSSILEGRELLKEDLFWKVGNGDSIRVFKDKWIPTGEEFRLKERQLEGEVENMMVKELITEGSWEFHGVGEHLNEEDKEQIRKIKLPGQQTADKPIWRRSRDGVYSVKLGYKAAWEKERVKKGSGASGSYRPSKGLWQGLWNIRICPKVHNFLWRAVSGALATNEALYRRRCAKSPACIICKTQVESVEHLLFLCPWAAQCWYSSPLH